jgi:hypothetical protein
MSGATARQNTANSGGFAPPNFQQQNMMARAAILAQSSNMVQQIAAGTVTAPGSTNNVINISPRLVGLCKRFWIEIAATVTNTATTAITLSELGPSTVLSNVQFFDLSNNVRINTAGWHLHMISSAKRGRVYGSAVTTDSPVGFGNNVNTVIQAPATIAAAGSATINMLYEVPLTYSDTDLRGAIWLGVTNATANLQFTINPAPIAAAAPGVLGLYYGGTGSISSLTYTISQNYLDQLPVGKKGVILPINDIATVYLLNNTTQQNMTANQDFPIPYSNFRDFLSTTALFLNGTALNAGSDVAYWAIQAANYVNFMKFDPTLAALWARNTFGDDLPKGMYYFSHRHKPISTAQYGNTELVLNASTVNANANLYLGYEQFALVNLIAQAGALSIA